MGYFNFPGVASTAKNISVKSHLKQDKETPLKRHMKINKQ
jgi:hypothetical protein